ncbi:MAG: Uma2 family endonuclease [Gloeobacterales cyanobacterium]
MTGFATDSLTLDVKSTRLTDEQFFELCSANRELRFERSAAGELIIMAPTAWGTGNQNAEISGQLWAWNRQTRLGKVFDSSTGFRLANGADRSPDASWVSKDRLEALNADPAKFLPLAPDFVVELRSQSDALKPLQTKMQEYIDNGVRLGWLIDSKNQRVEIYRLGQEVEVLESPVSLSGEDVLPGFSLDLSPLWA